MHIDRPLLLAAIAYVLWSSATGAQTVRVTVIGTTDLHGRVERTAVLSGVLDVVRADVNNGAVVLVDGGDMFQGTLESNTVEGASVVSAYNALKYDAVAVGNHEFDFGPAGPLSQPKSQKDDPQGALKARAKAAKFPFLAANIFDDATTLPVAWPNVKPSVLLKKHVGKRTVNIGVIGVTTIDTKHTTSVPNTAGITISPLRDAVLTQADRLRRAGADVVVLAAHAGGKCEQVTDPNDNSSCDQDNEIFTLARALPLGLVDVIVAGHTHNQMAQVINGTAIVIAWANGKGFSRVDLDVDVKAHKATVAKVHMPTQVCSDENAGIANCAAPDYDGHPVQTNTALLATLKPTLDKADALRNRTFGITITGGGVTRAYDHESALGNLFTDLMRESAANVFHEAIDVAVMNGGGIRADLPDGTLKYGALFEMMPFDNRFALLKLKGSELSEMLASNLSARKGGILSVSGVQVNVTCAGPKASVRLVRNGKAIGPDEIVNVVTTDFLSSGGDGALDPARARDGVLVDEGEPIREHLALALQKRAGTSTGTVIDGASVALLDAHNPRMKNEHQPSARCQK